MISIPTRTFGPVKAFRASPFSTALVLSVAVLAFVISPVWLVSPLAAQTPVTKQHIYSETADPRADITAGIEKAHKEHKRVLIDFGGDWCGDCQVLDIYFHQDPNAALLQSNFVLVHVWIGRMDRNLDVAQQYGVPIKSGVPALAVLSDTGKVVYSQETGQFRDMRHMDASSVTEFLTKWKKS